MLDTIIYDYIFGEKKYISKIKMKKILYTNNNDILYSIINQEFTLFF